MRDLFSSAWSFLKYWLKKEDLYSQHSPFVFSIYKELQDYLRNPPQVNHEIEDFRHKLLLDPTTIEIEDLGAGSKKINQPKRQIRHIAKFSTSNPKFSTLFQYFCQLTPANHVLELGTCLGISSRYLSKVTKGKLWTIEGSEKIWEIAKFSPKPENTCFLLGDIDEILPNLLLQVKRFDFILIDANHTLEATLKSFYRCIPHLHAKSILILGDIHWSREMELSWLTIKKHPSVRLTIDFFECGVVFFDYPGPKTHLVLDI